ncbi:MAG: hypothetical protein KGR16_05845 [Verrucomicrobia bacterium]|nr:hypothetical protein [Verrucomicrobiota bacterium]MDE3047716.1 hypothetical protein [Verrucomicrobiota bacterium]
MSDALTTESLRKKFKNNFDLCNFSISIARAILMGGTPATLDEILHQIELRAAEHRG